MAEPDLLLPARSVLLHIGPYKTGTTALQASLHQHRADLLDHGVLYPGTRRRQARPVFALLGRSLPGQPDVPTQEWDDLVAEVRQTDAARVVISSEDFSTLDRDVAARAVADLGVEHVHVVTVARNLTALLPSAWQERVKTVNETAGYDEFLTDVLAENPVSPSAQVFWRHHSLASLLGVWTDVLPADRVTVVVADESRRTQLRGITEELLGVPALLLTEGPASNASLTWDRVEVLRALNLRLQDGAWNEREQQQLVRRGFQAGLTAAAPALGEAGLPPLPPWALPRLAELGEQRVEQLRGSRARVVGDPSHLLSPAPGDEPVEGSSGARPEGRDETMRDAPTTVPIDVALSGLEELIGLLARRRGRAPRKARGVG